MDAKVQWQGLAIPYVVRWHEGTPRFADVDPEKLAEVLRQQWCGLCGYPLTLTDIVWIGGQTHYDDPQAWFGDPPLHQTCARYSVQHCPFLRGETTAPFAQLYFFSGHGVLVDGLRSRPLIRTGTEAINHLR